MVFKNVGLQVCFDDGCCAGTGELDVSCVESLDEDMTSYAYPRLKTPINDNLVRMFSFNFQMVGTGREANSMSLYWKIRYPLV